MKKLILSSLVVAAVALAGAAKSEAEHHKTQEDVTWTKPFGPQGPDFGFVLGEMGNKKPASFFIKMPAGADSGWHIHDEDYEAVVIKGTFAEQQQGEAAETPLPAGSYFTQTGKKDHRNGCAKDADCLVYVHFDKGANSKPMTADGKPAPMPPPGAAAAAPKK